jgi:hypothetical protein
MASPATSLRFQLIAQDAVWSVPFFRAPLHCPHFLCAAPNSAGALLHPSLLAPRWCFHVRTCVRRILCRCPPWDFA